MALYLDRYTRAGYGQEREHTRVRMRHPLVNGMFNDTWTVEEARREARPDVFLDRTERLFSLRILSSPEDP